MPSIPHMYNPFYFNVPHQSDTFVSIDEPTLTHHFHQSPQFPLSFTLDDVQSVGLDKCMVTCIHHYINSIITEWCHCPKKSSVPIHPSSSQPRYAYIFNLFFNTISQRSPQGIEIVLILLLFVFYTYRVLCSVGCTINCLISLH